MNLGVAGDDRVIITDVGNLGVGTNTLRSDVRFSSGTAVSSKRWGCGGAPPSSGSTISVYYIIIELNVGQYMAHGNQSWTVHSDERIKENIVDVGSVLPSLKNMRLSLIHI